MTAPAKPKSQALHERARKVMPGGNTRAIVWQSPYPTYLASGKGAYVTDVDGNRYLDLLNNYYTLIHGHARAEVVEAMTRQAALGACFSLPTEREIELAEVLCGRVKSFDEIRFTNTGTDAVMFALKGARALTGRPMIAKCEGAYHGAYEPVEVSVETSPERWGNRPAKIIYSKGTPEKMVSDVLVTPFNRTEESLSILSDHAKNLAAILVDPMPARIGPVFAEKAYLEALRAFCDKHGIVLIFDEVACFRAGHGGVQSILGIDPDMTTLGKIIGGGLPVGAVAGKREFMRVFDPSKGKPDAPHSGTFSANPMTMAAGHAAMSLLTPAAFEHLSGLGKRLQKGVAAAISDAKADMQVIGYGSTWRIHPHTRDIVDYRTSHPAPAEAARMSDFVKRLFAKGFIVSGNGSMALSTAMVDADIDSFVAAVGETLREQSATTAMAS
ncbi:MAG: aspartate aminotransferase family protein [Hyphomicrobiaceae bacterium]